MSTPGPSDTTSRQLDEAENMLLEFSLHITEVDKDRFIGDMSIEEYDRRIKKLEADAIAKLSVLIEEAKQHGFHEATKGWHGFSYGAGDRAGQYEILERLNKPNSGRQTKFRVRCTKCGDEFNRYPNKFRMQHKDCFPEKLDEERAHKGSYGKHDDDCWCKDQPFTQGAKI